jgi:uncharacterized protein (TIGR02594 family)
MLQPSWMVEAWRDFGQREVAGEDNNPRIVTMYRDAGAASVTDDETAWCAAYVGACLSRVGIKPSGSLMARSYLGWGETISVGRPGAIAVFSRGGDPTFGHVAFWLGETARSIVVLGGNQGDAVTVQAFPRERLLGLRWPNQSGVAQAADANENENEKASVLFDTALAHVLAMEGGYSDDPFDPGGPTNKGITLKTFADWLQITVDGANVSDLKQRLRSIPDATVASIYQARYWQPCSAASLPASLALMHFDAAVNHGVGTANRLLQQALGVAIDGEIGPLTKAAAADQSMPATLSRYADLRRARYRALSSFWRFGRGWLNRVDRTLAKATLLNNTASTTLKKGQPTMTNSTLPPVSTMPNAPKWWGQSMTIWGALIAAAATVLPALGPIIGVVLTPDMIQQLGVSIPAAIQAVVSLIGTVMAIYGRVRASQPIERRQVTLMM